MVLVSEVLSTASEASMMASVPSSMATESSSILTAGTSLAPKCVISLPEGKTRTNSRQDSRQQRYNGVTATGQTARRRAQQTQRKAGSNDEKKREQLTIKPFPEKEHSDDSGPDYQARKHCASKPRDMAAERKWVMRRGGGAFQNKAVFIQL